MIMLFNKREKSKERVLKAYREYLEARKEFCKETGWNFSSNQIIESKAEYEAERTEFVNKLIAIEKEFNNK